MNNRENIQLLIQKGLVQEAIIEAIGYSMMHNAFSVQNSLIVLKSKIIDTTNKWNTGVISLDEYNRNISHITQSVLEFVDQIEDRQIDTTTTLNEFSRINFHVHIINWREVKILTNHLMANRVIVILMLLYHSRFRGGFSNDQFLSNIAYSLPFLLSIFIIYLFSNQKKIIEKRKQKKNHKFLLLINCLVLFLFYYFIIEKLRGFFSYGQMLLAFAILDCLLIFMFSIYVLFDNNFSRNQ